MVRVAPIKLQYNAKTLWFDPGDLEIGVGDAVVVSTRRGTEFGYAVDDVIDVEESRIKEMKCALKPVIRVADESDLAQAAEMNRKGEEALPVFKEMAFESALDMHPVAVEYLFDGNKAVFYFEAEESVDFRELVRRLAGHFHVRVDMRQIGVRDEARIIGGLGHCGQELCCKRLGGEFRPVSIRMAKEQDLSLNPQKISGVCGRLMCCLRYEFDAYKEFKGRAPKINAAVETPEGTAKVVELDVPLEIVTLKMPDGKKIKMPLSAMDEPPEGSKRPNSIGQDAFDRYADADALASSSPLTGSVPDFTGTDKLAEAGAVHANHRSQRKKTGGGNDEAVGSQGSGQGSSHRRRRRRGGSKAAGSAPAQEGSSQRSDSRGHASEGRAQAKEGAAGGKQGSHQRRRPSSQKRGKGGEAVSAGSSKSGPRPGQHSSGMRASSGKPSERTSTSETGSSHRKTRRRSHHSGANGSGGASGQGGDKGAKGAQGQD